MHQTTVRFGPDLWEALELECRRLGVSAAQYLREAALARLAYTAGRVGANGYELALLAAGAKPIASESPAQAVSPSIQAQRTHAAVAAAEEMAEEGFPSREALQTQNALVLARSRVLRESALELARSRDLRDSSERIRSRRPVRNQ